jgi:hypothetical protein
MLKAAGVPPVPERPTSWQTFLGAHWGAIAGADFFTTDAWTWRGVVTYDTVLVIDVTGSAERWDSTGKERLVGRRWGEIDSRKRNARPQAGMPEAGRSTACLTRIPARAGIRAITCSIVSSRIDDS